MTSILYIRIAIIVFFSVLGLASDVKNDFNSTIDLARFKTFSFLSRLEIEKTGVLSHPVIRDQKYGLASRYRLALRQKSDVIVISTGPTMGMGYDPYASYPGYWGGYPLDCGGTGAYSYDEYVVNHSVQGTLIVDWIAPETKELVWRIFLKQKIGDRARADGEAKKNLYKALNIFPPSPSDKDKMRDTRSKMDAKYR